MENIYISWHFTTHGIAYFKHILAAFYSGKCSLTQKQIKAENLSQEEMNTVFDKPLKNGFTFDKIYYLTADAEIFNKIVTYNIFKRNKFYEDDELLKEKKLTEEWKDVISRHLSLQDEYIYISNHYPDKKEDMLNFVWRNIQHYPIEEQIWWFKTQSNAKDIYRDKIDFINMTKEYGIDDLRDYVKIADATKKLLQKIFSKHKDANFIINPSLTSNQIQVVWFSLAAAGFLPQTVRFINTYDRKDKYPDKRFKLFDITEVPTNIVKQISDKVRYFDQPKSESRKLADAKMQHYIKSGFAVLLLGERGIGKTRLAEKYKRNKNFVAVNCASFTNSQIAESELFGYVKGAFTDAKSDKDGYFKQADGGILFLDEIHHLDKLTQAKLMKAIQTDENNRFTIRPLGSKNEIKVNVTLILASNKKISELRKLLLPDFYDRITQLVIELPPLRASKEDIKNDFKAIWFQMRFNEFYNYDENVKNDKQLFEWLRELPLYGNYRDLQKIAIYYKTFLDFDASVRKILKEKSAFEFAKLQFEKYISYSDTDDFFDTAQNPKELIKKYQKTLAKKFIDEYGSPRKIEDKFGITSRTIYNWIKE